MTASAPLPRYVTDTHALVFFFAGSAQLTQAALRAFEEVAQGTAELLVPTIVLVELQYLEEKGRIDAGTAAKARQFVGRAPRVTQAALDLPVADAVARVARDAVPDMPDRIISATALAHGAPLITKDSRIVAWGGVRIIW